MNERNLFDMLPDYALGALSEDEKAQVEAWLATSPEARAQLRDYQTMLTGMVALTPPRQAPDHLLDDFRTRLAASASAEKPPRAPVRVARWIILSGVAAVLIAAIALVYVLTTADARAIQAIRDNPQAITISLVAQNSAPGAVTLIALPNSTRAVLVAQLPTLQPTQQYELWLIGNQPVNSGVFTMDRPAQEFLMTLPGQVEDYKVTAITVEPRSEKGQPAPTSKPIFAADIPTPKQ